MATSVGGRPTDYSTSITDIVCERLACGESMRSVSRDPDMPSMTSLFKWLREHEEFAQQYARAKEESADALVEDMLDIADNGVGNPVIGDDGVLAVDDDGKALTVVDGPSVAHAKLKVDTRKWAASKLKPKKYGEKVQQEISGPNGGPIVTASLSDEDLATEIAKYALKQPDS